MERRTFLAAGLTASAVALLPGVGHAQRYVAARMTRDQRVLLERAIDQLEGMTTARGRFTQTSPRGSVSTGTLYLDRPGKARFEYDAPAQMVVVADGRNVSVYDGRLKTFDRYPLNSTPLSLFLARRIRLDDRVVITTFTETDDGFSMTLRESGTAGAPGTGGLVMDFAKAPLGLRGWTSISGQSRTQVRLSGLAPTGPLDQALFTLTDPRRSG